MKKITYKILSMIPIVNIVLWIKGYDDVYIGTIFNACQ